MGVVLTHMWYGRPQSSKARSTCVKEAQRSAGQDTATNTPAHHVSTRCTVRRVAACIARLAHTAVVQQPCACRCGHNASSHAPHTIPAPAVQSQANITTDTQTASSPSPLTTPTNKQTIKTSTPRRRPYTHTGPDRVCGCTHGPLPPSLTLGGKA